MSSSKKTSMILRISIGTIISLSILFRVIKSNWISILAVIIFGGGLTYLIDSVANHEYSNSFETIKKINKYAHPRVQKMWKVAKGLAYIFILKIVGVDFLQVALDIFGQESNSTRLLFDSALVATVSIGIVVIISAAIRKESMGPTRVVKIKKPVRIRMNIPSDFLEEKLDTDKVTAFYRNHFTEEIINIVCEKKECFQDEISCREYAELVFESMEMEESITIVNINELKHRDSYELDLIMNKVKCKGLMKIVENEKMFILLRMYALREQYEKDKIKYMDVLDSVAIG